MKDHWLARWWAEMQRSNRELRTLVAIDEVMLAYLHAHWGAGLSVADNPELSPEVSEHLCLSQTAPQHTRPWVEPN